MGTKSPDMPMPDVSDVGDVVASPGRRVTIPNPIVGSVVGAGKALKAGGEGLSKLIRAGWRNKRDLALITATVAASRSYQAADFTKKVVTEGRAAIHDPKGTAGSATSEAGQVLLNAADVAIAKGRQGMEIVGEKVDLPGTNNHGTESAPANPEKKN